MLEIPRIFSGPVQIPHQNKIMLQCQFNASTLRVHTYEVTVVAWKRNNIQLSNSSLYNIIQGSSSEDVVVSTLMINSSDYYGTYTCYCYYNNSLITSSKHFTSDQSSLTLDPPDSES